MAKLAKLIRIWLFPFFIFLWQHFCNWMYFLNDQFDLNMSKSYDCERNLTSMISISNSMVYSWNNVTVLHYVQIVIIWTKHARNNYSLTSLITIWLHTLILLFIQLSIYSFTYSFIHLLIFYLIFFSFFFFLAFFTPTSPCTGFFLTPFDLFWYTKFYHNKSYRSMRDATANIPEI